jgi:hypothetical protein
MLPISLLMEENGNMETKIIDQLKADTIETIEEKIALIKNERLASISQGQLDLLKVTKAKLSDYKALLDDVEFILKHQ